MHILHSADIDITGFAGVRERIYVMDRRWFSAHGAQDAAPGIGALIYLADAHMREGGQTGLHPHRQVHILSWLLNGRLLHRGDLGDGTLLQAGQIQIQKGGAAGFSHNEINPGPGTNRFLQLWFRSAREQAESGLETVTVDTRPEQLLYLADDGVTRCQCQMLATGERRQTSGPALLFVLAGEISVGGPNTEEVALGPGSLCQAEALDYKAAQASRLLLVTA